VSVPFLFALAEGRTSWVVRDFLFSPVCGERELNARFFQWKWIFSLFPFWKLTLSLFKGELSWAYQAAPPLSDPPFSFFPPVELGSGV